MRTRKFKLLASLLILAFPFAITSAEVMSSANYKLQTDSLNFGGKYSTSSSYGLEDTMGEIATGISSSTNYVMNAGYQQMQQSYISISASGNPDISPSINGVSGGFGLASTTWLVTTDNAAGYSLSIRSTETPAMRGLTNGDSIADYVPAGAVPDYDFNILETESSFGFNPVGVDVTTRFRNDGLSTCGTGSTNAIYKCWDGFSLDSKVIAQSTSANHPLGATTTTIYQAKIGASKIQTSGDYAATIIVTALTL